MENQWSLLKEVKSINDNHIEALAEVSADSLWFSGHFPGDPILPGIALIHIVKQAITQDALKKSDNLHLYALKKVKFAQPVRPGDALSVSINAENTGEDIWFSFKVLKRENVVCSGMIAARNVSE